MINQHNMKKLDLDCFFKNCTLLNHRNKKLFFFIICTIFLFVGCYIDYLWEGQHFFLYLPFVIFVGFIFNNLLIISSVVILLSFSIFLNENVSISEFIVQTLLLLLISFLMNYILQKFYKEQEEIIVLASTLSKFLDARDTYTAFHSENVAYYSYEIGRAIKLPKDDCLNLYLGGLLHDIGKIGISEKILNKQGKLTDKEFEIIKKHPQMGYDILKKVPYLQKKHILEMVLFHHEKFNGTGYPYGLKGYDIPKVARIITVADSFDAMTSKRVYREEKDVEYAINELKKGKGTQFDPEIVDVFLELIEQNKIEIRGRRKEEPSNQ